MGRKAIPTTTKIASGNPGKQIFRIVPDPPCADRPEPPAYLDINGLWAWNWLLGNLEAMRLLSGADIVMMETFASTYMRYRIAEAELAKLRETSPLNSLIFKTKKDNYIQQPLIGITNQCATRLKTLAAEFGLTPSARASLGLDRSRGKPSKFKGMLGNGRG